MDIVRSTESHRGCGYRKSGKRGFGLYLIGDALAAPCGRLPLPLGRCPCCSAGIKPSRGWTWIEPRQLFAQSACKSPAQCPPCPLGMLPEGQHGLLWVGEVFYPTPAHFTREAAKLGISRRLGALPRGFRLGETYVFLAHRATIWDEVTQMHSPGIFQLFKPTGVDLVIDPDASEPPEAAVRMAESIGEGARIVQVLRDGDTQTDLFSQEQADG